MFILFPLLFDISIDRCTTRVIVCKTEIFIFQYLIL